MEKIVIVDDDADIRRIAELRLRITGFNVLTAEDGEAGLALIRAEKPRVVPLDLMMPKMHAFAVCQAIRSDSSLQGTFIIVTSAKTYAADIKKVKELGADLYINKPYDLDPLVVTIQKALADLFTEMAMRMRDEFKLPNAT
jgi:DNA-binding response OmpR family regulator